MINEGLVEVLEARKGVVYDIVSEVMEDIALAHAIKAGEATESVDKREMLDRR